MNTAAAPVLTDRTGTFMQRADGAASIIVKAGPAGRTMLDQLHQRANAKVRIPRGPHAHLEAALINTAGGLTGGDQLAWRCEAGIGTELVVTTQAAERICRSTGGHAVQMTHLTVAKAARIDWLPQETILFDASRLDRTLDADLAESVSRDGDAAALLTRKSVTAGWCAVATIVLVPATEEDALRAAQTLRLAATLRPTSGDVCIGTTELPGRLVARIVARDSYVLRPVLARLLSALRDDRPLPTVWQG